MTVIDVPYPNLTQHNKDDKVNIFEDVNSYEMVNIC
jgi:hypothetical protein